MIDRATIEVAPPPAGWPPPWPNVAEIELVLPHEKWTLVGGLMTQLHAIHRGVNTLRPTLDVDMVLHIETTRGVAAQTAAALQTLGYEFMTPLDDRTATAHRFQRSNVDTGRVDVVDVLMAEHAAPDTHQKLGGKSMVAIEGGTQALKRTINARLEIVAGHTSTISVPSPLGAAILKAAAYLTDSRDPQRHLQDAALLLAVIDDPFEERKGLGGSDRRRLRVLVAALPDDHSFWHRLDEPWRTDGQSAIRILTRERGRAD